MNKTKKPFSLFVSPPLAPEKQAGSLAGIANVLPPLGIGFIAAYLEKNNYPVEIVECLGNNFGIDEVVNIVKEKNPDIICFTATILTINTAIEMTKTLKKKFPKKIFVIGGPQFTCDIKKTMKNGVFDYGVYGEGELTYLEFVKTIEKNGSNFNFIPGLVYRKNNKIMINKPRSYIRELDNLPTPAWHLYPSLDKYHPVPASYKKLPVGLAISSRGCPYNCIFCDRRVFGTSFRAHSAKYVVDHIEEMINRFGAKEIRFMDDTFTMNKKRVYEICEEISKRKIKILWTCLTRVDRVDENILKTMKKAGCWQIIYGIESGSQRMLDIMKKSITLKQIKDAVHFAKKAKMNIRATFVFGLPGETLDSIKQTVDFAIKLKLDVVTFFTVVLYPGNELFQIANKQGKVLHTNYDEYTSIIDSNITKLHYVPESLTEKELKNAIVGAYRRYYFRFYYILREILTIRSFEDIHRYIKAFFSILKYKKVK